MLKNYLYMWWKGALLYAVHAYYSVKIDIVLMKHAIRPSIAFLCVFKMYNFYNEIVENFITENVPFIIILSNSRA